MAASLLRLANQNTAVMQYRGHTNTDACTCDQLSVSCGRECCVGGAVRRRAGGSDDWEAAASKASCPFHLKQVLVIAHHMFGLSHGEVKDYMSPPRGDVFCICS